MALIGHVDEISRARVEGWVSDSEHPDEAVSVSIIVNGVHRGMCLTTHARADLVLPSGEAVAGNSAFHFTFDPPLSPFIEQRIEVVETWSAQMLYNGSRILPKPEVSGHAGIVPILLTSTGRTGTTLLMNEFARHPDIVVGDQFPYEIKQIAYHAAAFRVLAADADWDRSTTPETMLAPEMNRIVGSNPYNLAGLFGLGGGVNALRRFYQNSVPSGYATLFRGFISEFYRTLAEAQGKRTALFFCEKGDVEDAGVQGARLFFEAVKDIIMVRDPRDLLCSAIAFWKLRPEAAMTMLSTTIPQLGRIARNAGPDTLVVRYEELVGDPLATRLAISDFLDLELADAAAAKTAAIPESHRTSRDGAASIGRWRSELTPEQIEACEAAFGPYMRHFGYEPSAHPRPAARAGDSDLIVAAEGAFAVAAFVENTVGESGEGSPWRHVLEVTFGRQSTGEAFTLEGWSLPERGFVWSGSNESRVRLPPIRRSGDHVLHITAAPFIHGAELPSQRVTVLLNGVAAGTARVRDICVLSVPIPAAVSQSGETITLTLLFPDAARPSSLHGGDDDRTLGFSLHRIALFGIDSGHQAGELPATRPVAGRIGLECDASGQRAIQARIAGLLREAFNRPELRCRPRAVIRELPGFDHTSFIRLILAVEAEFGIELREPEVDSILTMNDILTLVKDKASNAGQAATEAAL